MTEKESVADLAVYQQLKQVSIFGEVAISSEQMPRLAEWYSWIDQQWNAGKIQGKQQLEEICDRLASMQSED